MEEFGLPERLFQTGYEPSGRKRINNYFNLRWIEVVKAALTDAQQEMLAESQFRQLMLMGSHTFSVMFAHQLLSRQLVTRKLYELWWLFAGKPIRYGIGDFALVTGLNCGTPPTTALGGHRMVKGKKKGKAKAKQVGGDGAVWQALFGSEETITAEWIISKLGQKDKYKDEVTRLRLSLLLLVEGILCPTSGSTQVRPEVVEMLGDIGLFLEYPWGRESFLLTVTSGKIRSAGQLAQDTLAIQGFAHAMVLVTVCSCPQIIADPRLGEDLVDDDLPIEDIVDGVCARTIKINVITVQTLELTGQASVRSILSEGTNIPALPDEVDDVRVNHMVSLIRDRFPFEINTWRGGVKASDAKQSKGFPVVGEATTDGVGQSGGNAQAERQQNNNPEGIGGGAESGERLDVPTIVRLVTNELHARVVPMVSSFKDGICREIQSLKQVVLRSSTLDSAGFEDCQLRHSAGTLYAGIGSGIDTNTGNGDHQRQSGTRPSLKEIGQVSSSGGPVIANDGRPLSPIPSVPSEKTPIGTGSGAPPPAVDSPEDAATLRRGINTERDTASIDCVVAEITAASSATEEERHNQGASASKNSSTMQTDISFSDPPIQMDVPQMPMRPPPAVRRSEEVVSEPIKGDSSSERVGDKIGQIVGPSDGGTNEAAVNKDSCLVEPEQASVVPCSEPENPNPVTTSIEDSHVSEETGTIDPPKQETAPVAVRTRASKRSRIPTIKYTPPAPAVKKPKGTKPGGRTQKVAAKVTTIVGEASSAATTPTKPSTSFVSETKVGPFVGGFSPCVRLNAFRLAGFCTLMHTEREYDLGEGVIVDNKVFRSFFDSTQPQPSKAADMVVTFIRKRLRGEGITTYDFLPASFGESLRGEYQQFCRVTDIGNFSFSNIFANPVFPNMKWDGKVQVIYLPFQVDRRHWVGLVIDIANWCIHVLDCNPACLTTEKLEALLNPIVLLLPLLIRVNGGKASNEAAMESSMPITRVDLPLLCEQPGFSCIASIVLMELHASQNMFAAGSLTDESLEIAAQTYAVEAFGLFHPDYLREFSVA